MLYGIIYIPKVGFKFVFVNRSCLDVECMMVQKSMRLQRKFLSLCFSALPHGFINSLTLFALEVTLLVLNGALSYISCVCRILVHLSRGDAEVQMFAPDVAQMHVIDHGKGQPAEKELRWV